MTKITVFDSFQLKYGFLPAMLDFHVNAVCCTLVKRQHACTQMNTHTHNEKQSETNALATNVLAWSFTAFIQGSGREKVKGETVAQ